MATHSSILAWKIPWTEEPGGLQSMGAWRVGHDRATEHAVMVILFLIFWEPSILFSSGYTNLQSHLTVKEGSFFSTPSPAFVICRVLNHDHSDHYEVIPHHNLICISLIINVEHFFCVCVYGYLYVFFGCLFRSSAHFLIGFFVFLILSCMSCL